MVPINSSLLLAVPLVNDGIVGIMTARWFHCNNTVMFSKYSKYTSSNARPQSRLDMMIEISSIISDKCAVASSWCEGI